MVKIAFNPKFETSFSKIKDDLLKEKIIKQIEKIKINPEVGKPMMHDRRGTRELYIKPFRLAYSYIKSEDKVIILEFYHKKEQ
jgi:mRNA-degrading endonuclease RelE of RelBE toxin-antitoxin system